MVFSRKPKWPLKWLPPVSLQLWTLLLIYLSPNSFQFYILITLIKPSFKFKYGFCQTNDKLDGRQNGHHFSVFICGHSTVVIYYLIAVKFHIRITLINFLPEFQYGLCLITRMATKIAPNV